MRQVRTLVFVVLGLLPLAAVGAMATTAPAASLLTHLSRTVLPMQLGYSLAAAGLGTLAGMGLALASPLCALFSFPGRAMLSRLLLVPLLIPGWYLAIMMQTTWGAGGLWALVLVLGITTAPIYHLFAIAALGNLPQHYVEALRMSGRGAPHTLLRTLVPLAAPALVAAAALVFLVAWSDLAIARVTAVPTLTVGLFNQMFGRHDESIGALISLILVAVSLIPAALAWAVLSRTARHDQAQLVGRPLQRSSVRGWRSAVPWLLGAPEIALGVVFPLGVVVVWTAERIDRVALQTLFADLSQTLLLATSSVALAAAVALLLLHTQITTTAPRLTTAASMVALALFALPAPVLGLSFIWLLPFATEAGLAGRIGATVAPLIVAFAARFVVVFLAAGQTAMLRQARARGELLRLMGRTSLAGTFGPLGPYLAGPLAAATLFVYLEVLKDLQLTLLLQPFGMSTLTTHLFQYAQTQRVKESAVLVLCIVLVGLYPLVALARLVESGTGDAA